MIQEASVIQQSRDLLRCARSAGQSRLSEEKQAAAQQQSSLDISQKAQNDAVSAAKAVEQQERSKLDSLLRQSVSHAAESMRNTDQMIEELLTRHKEIVQAVQLNLQGAKASDAFPTLTPREHPRISALSPEAALQEADKLTQAIGQEVSTSTEKLAELEERWRNNIGCLKFYIMFSLPPLPIVWIFPGSEDGIIGVWLVLMTYASVLFGILSMFAILVDKKARHPAYFIFNAFTILYAIAGLITQLYYPLLPLNLFFSF